MANLKLIGTLAVVGTLLVVAVPTYISTHNQAVRMESQIKAQYKSNQNSLSNTTLKIQEMFSVRDEYYKDLKDIISKTFTGRYGKDGSKAVFQFLKENNLNPDSQLDKNVQMVIEQGRNEFKASQDSLISMKQGYDYMLNSFVGGSILSFQGFPKIDLDEYDVIIESGTTQKFQNKQDTRIKLR